MACSPGAMPSNSAQKPIQTLDRNFKLYSNLEGLRDTIACPVCKKVMEVSVLLVPCSHKTCYSCSKHAKKCPVCFKNVDIVSPDVNFDQLVDVVIAHATDRLHYSLFHVALHCIPNRFNHRERALLSMRRSAPNWAPYAVSRCQKPRLPPALPGFVTLDSFVPADISPGLSESDVILVNFTGGTHLVVNKEQFNFLPFVYSSKLPRRLVEIVEVPSNISIVNCIRLLSKPSVTYIATVVCIREDAYVLELCKNVNAMKFFPKLPVSVLRFFPKSFIKKIELFNYGPQAPYLSHGIKPISRRLRERDLLPFYLKPYASMTNDSSTDPILTKTHYFYLNQHAKIRNVEKMFRNVILSRSKNSQSVSLSYIFSAAKPNSNEYQVLPPDMPLTQIGKKWNATIDTLYYTPKGNA